MKRYLWKAAAVWVLVILVSACGSSQAVTDASTEQTAEVQRAIDQAVEGTEAARAATRDAADSAQEASPDPTQRDSTTPAQLPAETRALPTPEQATRLSEAILGAWTGPGELLYSEDVEVTFYEGIFLLRWVEEGYFDGDRDNAAGYLYEFEDEETALILYPYGEAAGTLYPEITPEGELHLQIKWYDDGAMWDIGPLTRTGDPIGTAELQPEQAIVGNWMIGPQEDIFQFTADGYIAHSEGGLMRYIFEDNGALVWLDLESSDPWEDTYRFKVIVPEKELFALGGLIKPEEEWSRSPGLLIFDYVSDVAPITVEALAGTWTGAASGGDFAGEWEFQQDGTLTWTAHSLEADGTVAQSGEPEVGHFALSGERTIYATLSPFYVSERALVFQFPGDRMILCLVDETDLLHDYFTLQRTE